MRGGTDPDGRDRSAAALVVLAGVVEVVSLVANVVTDPELASLRTSTLLSSTPHLLVSAAFYVVTVAGLVGERRQLGRALAAALGLRAAVGLTVGGVLSIGASAAWSFGWLSYAVIATDVLLLAALGLVVAVWQDRGAPRLGRSPGVVGTMAIVGAVVALAAAWLPPLGSGPLLDVGGRSWRGAGYAFGFGANALVILAMVWLAVRVATASIGRAVLLLVALGGLAGAVGTVVGLATLDATGVRPTLWLGLATSGWLAVLVAALRIGETPSGGTEPVYTSSETA